MSIWSDVKCPVCKSPGAKQLLWMVKCPHNGCDKYDPDLALEARSRVTASAHSVPLTGSFNPGLNAITIRYRNAAGIDKTYTGDKTTVKAANAHITICLVPTGKRCSFSRERIMNLAEITPYIPPADKLSSVDRQILGYHQSKGTTSPRHEAVKQKLGKPA
ncbi:MAG: hypothetical protein WCN95_15800 [bacterium]